VVNREKTWIVMPAYNAENTLEATFFEIPLEMRARLILVDDYSKDGTVSKARGLGIEVIEHSENRGYGANQKTCYKAALEKGAEVVIMIHPDHQYDPRVAGVMSDLIMLGNCDVLLGNRIRTRREALSGGMPKWRYFLNRISTFIENLLLGQTIGDWHSGLRAYSRKSLETINYDKNSNSFAFDQEFLVQAVARKLKIADIPIDTRYGVNSSSISIRATFFYGVGGLTVLVKYFLHKFHIKIDEKFKPVFQDKELPHG
jgi:glycosyltransferase involved in cell wall biosynthesis